MGLHSVCNTYTEPLRERSNVFSLFADSGQGVVKLDVQPKCVAVGPGGYAVVVCIGQVRALPRFAGYGQLCAVPPRSTPVLTDIFIEHCLCYAEDVTCSLTS